MVINTHHYSINKYIFDKSPKCKICKHPITNEQISVFESVGKNRKFTHWKCANKNEKMMTQMAKENVFVSENVNHREISNGFKRFGSAKKKSSKKRKSSKRSSTKKRKSSKRSSTKKRKSSKRSPTKKRKSSKRSPTKKRKSSKRSSTKKVSGVTKKRASRPSPKVSATLFSVGTVKKGNDGTMYVVKKASNGVKRWGKKPSKR